MGGTVGVESRPGPGSTNWLTVAFERASGPLRQPAGAAHLLDGRRILVIDDNDTNRLVLASQLRAWYIAADEVADAGSALELPERAQLAIGAGELTMADVAALVKVKDQPELIEEVLGLPAWNRHDIAMVIERRIAQRRQEEAYDEAVAEQEAKGRRVIESASVSQSKAKRLRDLGFKGGRPPERAVPRGGDRALPARR